MREPWAYLVMPTRGSHAQTTGSVTSGCSTLHDYQAVSPVLLLLAQPADQILVPGNGKQSINRNCHRRGAPRVLAQQWALQRPAASSSLQSDSLSILVVSGPGERARFRVKLSRRFRSWWWSSINSAKFQLSNIGFLGRASREGVKELTTVSCGVRCALPCDPLVRASVSLVKLRGRGLRALKPSGNLRLHARLAFAVQQVRTSVSEFGGLTRTGAICVFLARQLSTL